MINFSCAITSKGMAKEMNTMMVDLMNLAKKQVLVGVPEETNPRKEGTGIGNASLAYIHDNGSPLRGIPARPFMDPGIKAVQDRINKELMDVAKAQMNGEQDKVDAHLNRTGMIASSSIKNVINEGDFTPLKRSTLLGRLRALKSSRKWSIEKREETMESMRPLIATAQMRNAITYVVVQE